MAPSAVTRASTLPHIDPLKHLPIPPLTTPSHPPPLTTCHISSYLPLFSHLHPYPLTPPPPSSESRSGTGSPSRTYSPPPHTSSHPLLPFTHTLQPSPHHLTPLTPSYPPNPPYPLTLILSPPLQRITVRHWITFPHP